MRAEIVAHLDHVALLLMVLMRIGFDTLKFFPAEQTGGRAMLRARAGPFPDLRVCPTAGITEANAAEWLSEPSVSAVGGSWICQASYIKAGDRAGITAMCVRTMKALSQR